MNKNIRPTDIPTFMVTRELKLKSVCNGSRVTSPARSSWCSGRARGSPWSPGQSGTESWWGSTSPDRIHLRTNGAHLNPQTDNVKSTSRSRGLVSQRDLEKLVHPFIFSRLDYWNAAFTFSVKSKSESCSSSPHWDQESGSHPSSSEVFALTLRSCCWFIKHWMVQGRNTFVICYLTNHPGPSGGLGLVYFLFQESELNFSVQVFCSTFLEQGPRKLKVCEETKTSVHTKLTHQASIDLSWCMFSSNYK